MSSRTDHRRRERERSWEREDRDRDHDRDRDKDRYSRSARASGHRDTGRRRDSRSRSPRRDRREYERDRDYKSFRRDERRDHDRDRDGPRPDKKEDKRERKPERRDQRRDHYNAEQSTSRDKDIRNREPSRYSEPQRSQEARPEVQPIDRPEPPKHDTTSSKPIPDLDIPAEEGEEMDVSTAEDEFMMTMMGLSGFGSTKGKHVEGNQDGGVNIKKMRTWRQYMNRRGGFNRPLDKIK